MQTPHVNDHKHDNKPAFVSHAKHHSGSNIYPFNDKKNLQLPIATANVDFFADRASQCTPMMVRSQSTPKSQMLLSTPNQGTSPMASPKYLSPSASPNFHGIPFSERLNLSEYYHTTRQPTPEPPSIMELEMTNQLHMRLQIQLQNAVQHQIITEEQMNKILQSS